MVQTLPIHGSGRYKVFARACHNREECVIGFTDDPLGSEFREEVMTSGRYSSMWVREKDGSRPSAEAYAAAMKEN